MLHKQRYFDRNGREVAEHEAMRAGVLRDGFSLRIPTTLRDSIRFTDARSYWDANRDSLLVVDPQRVGGESGSRPGFRVSDSPINRQEIADARAEYLYDLQNAWRTPLRLGDAAPPRDTEDDEDDEDEDDLPQGELETATSDRRSIDQIAHEHRLRMAKLYDSYSAAISSAWKGPDK